MNYIGIIPARYDSTRFPGKPLVDMCGKPMIQRVYEQANRTLDTVYVATDDTRILECVESFGGKAVLTSTHHKSGTDRCYEAYQLIGGGEEVVINIQGDEPFVATEQIEALIHCFDSAETEIATLVKLFAPTDGWEALANPNTPKVVLNARQEAIYFSRSVVPYLRGAACEEWLEKETYYKHIGMYAYRADILAKLTELPQAPIEVTESLEQLRWLYNGYRIKVATTCHETIGIDTPADMERALQFMKNNG